MTDHAKAIIATAQPYWDAEAEIARRFYATAKPADHVFYLRAQLWKELNPVDGFFNGLHRELTEAAKRFPKVGQGMDRHDYCFLLSQLVSEYNHFVMMADILEHLLGRKLRPSDTVQLSEEKRLGELRRTCIRKGGAIGRAAVGITEGGGAALFRVAAQLRGSKLHAMTARAMKIIWDDEKGHYREQARIAAGLVRNRKDLAKMQDAIRAVSMQRVRMRNEMFRTPMTDAEVGAFIARRAARAGAK